MKRPDLENTRYARDAWDMPAGRGAYCDMSGYQCQRAGVDSALLSLRQWLLFTGGNRIDTTGPRWKSL
jgi:hypothetical protein